MAAITAEFNDLPGTSYNAILSQYTDNGGPDGYVHNDVSVMGTTVAYDVPPSGMNWAGLDGKAWNALNSNSSWLTQFNSATPQSQTDTTVVVIPQQGTTYSNVLGDPYNLTGFCGVHSWDNEIGLGNHNLNVALVKYGDDPECAGTGVGEQTAIDKMTSTASHEYAETATNPNAGGSWTTDDSPQGFGSSPPEIGDMCQAMSGAQTSLDNFHVTAISSNPAIQVQQLWDNSNTSTYASGQCDSYLYLSQDSSQLSSVCQTSWPMHTVQGSFDAATVYGASMTSMGCPADERSWTTANGGGWMEHFHMSAAGTVTGGIYAAGSLGTSTPHVLYGPIATDYAANFEPGKSSVGWPNGNEYTTTGNGYEADFAGGSILSDGGSNTGFVDTAIANTWKAWGGGSGPLGFPTGDETAIPGGEQGTFQHGVIDDQGAVNVFVNGRQVVGHARHTGNDYPYETLGQFGHTEDGTDAWNEFYGQCDSFAAWKAYENLAGTQQLPNVPTPAAGWTPSNASISPVNQFTWGPNGGKYGNADVWKSQWSARGYSVDNVPTPGAIAWWPNATTDTQDNNPPDPAHGIGNFGHVGYVTDVYPDGSITVEQYNMRGNGQYSVVHMNYNSGYTDNSFGGAGFTVPWPGGFIHVADGPSGAASPPEPAAGVLQAGYATQVKVIGPGSSAAEFSTGNVWYSHAGGGEIGSQLWTHDNGPTAVSTATWTPAGLAANTCYRVDAFVPNTYSDNPVAVYTVSDAAGTSDAAVNENVSTNDWAELGVFKTNGSGGGVSVRLDDRGATGLYVTADAMRFWRQADCGAEGNVSPIMMPSSNFPSAWSVRSGHGFFGNMQYSGTSGSGTPSANAQWHPTTLAHYGCYDVSLYVPDNYSDNNAASYWSNDVYYGPFYSQINENDYTNAFVGIGTFQAWGDGTLPLELFNAGPSGQYVAADAAAFVLNPHCQAENGGTNAFGSVPTSSIIGPGSSPSNFSTVGDWKYELGHGYANDQLYTPDNSSGANATWTFHGTANSCYQAQVYVPIQGYANNPNASYTVSTAVGALSATVNQNTGNGWVALSGNPIIATGADGVITVYLTSAGPAGSYTAADAISFIQVGGSCSMPGGLNPSAYPWPNVAPTTYIADGHGYYEGECTSFAAWAIRSDGRPHSKSPDSLGNAMSWTGVSSSSSPHVGDIAQWDPNVHGAGSLGHVAYVAAVNGDGTIEVYEYNWLDSYDNDTGHRLSIRTIPATDPSRFLQF